MCVSGLNLQSQFNLDNITVFNKNEQESTLGQRVRPRSKDYRYCIACELLNDIIDIVCVLLNVLTMNSPSTLTLCCILQPTEEKEDGMEVEEGEMGDEEPGAPAPWLAT
jgi:hypothetical protein